jgi:hypothetical protein
MSKLLGSILLTTAIVMSGAALACPLQESNATDDSKQTAQAPATDNQTVVPPASTTTTPKTTETKTGG